MNARRKAATPLLKQARTSMAKLIRKFGGAGGGKPPVGRIDFGSLRRMTPISRDYGFDRGGALDRYYIEAFLDRHRGDIRGRVLEIGDASYTRRFGGDRVTRSDVLHVSEESRNATIIADLADGEAIPSDAFDCVILTQTLHLIYDFHSAMRTLHRILHPGGVLLLTVPGISQIDCGEWGSYWAFTEASLRRVVGECFAPEMVKIGSHGNVLAAASFLYGLGRGELRQEELEHHDRRYQVLVTARATRARV